MGTKPLAEPTAQNTSTSRSQEETPPRQLRTRTTQQRSAETSSNTEDICSVCQKRFQPSTSRGETSRSGCRCWQAPESSSSPSSPTSRNHQITRASRSKRVRKKLELEEDTSPSTSSVQNIGTIEAPSTELIELSAPASTSSLPLPQRRKEQRHVCPVCSKPFGSPGKLGQHMYSHTGERPFQCQHCPKAFSSKFKLVRHVLIHSDERRYRCTACDRTFHRKDHLKNHVKVHSPVKKRFRCERPGCGKEYGSQLSFRKHTAVHSAEDGSLECKMCGKAFSSKEEIVYHLKVHAGSRTVKNPADKKYRCDYCDRRFFTRKDVRRHMVVHTGKRDFLCQFCPQRFGRKDHLVRHIKKSHHNQTTSGSSVSESTSSQTSGKRSAKRKELISPPIPSTTETELQHPPSPYSTIILTQFKYEPQSPASPTTSETSVQQTVPTQPSAEQSMILPFEEILIPGVPIGYDLPTTEDPVSTADLLPPLASILASSSSEDTGNNTAPLPRFNQAFHPQQPP